MAPSKSLRAQMGPFVLIPVWVLERCQDPRALRLYGFLAKYANREGRAWPTRQQLAADMGISVPTVTRLLTVLREIGVLKTTRRHRSSDGAVVGLDFLVMQVEPAELGAEVQKLTSEPMDDDADPITSEPQAETVHQLKSEPKVDDHQTITSEPKDASHQLRSDQSFGSDLSRLLKEELDPINQIQEQDLSAAPTDTVPLLTVYHDGFVGKFGQKPAITGAKDGKLLKLLTDSHSDVTVRQLLGWFFRIRDPFIQGTGYTVGVFYACFNKLLVTYRPPDPTSTDPSTELLRDMQARGRETRDRLEVEARCAIVALPVEARELLKRAVIEEFTRDYAGLVTMMPPTEYERAVKRAMVQHVVTLCRGGKSVTDVLGQFARTHAAPFVTTGADA